MVVFNTAHWTGDYIAEGVKSIPMDVNNISGPALELRLKFDGQEVHLYRKIQLMCQVAVVGSLLFSL